MSNLIMAGLIWGFLGTFTGAVFALLGPDAESRVKGAWVFAVCAPMWAIAYHFLEGMHP